MTAPVRRCLTCGGLGRWRSPRCPEHQAAFDARRERSPRRLATKADRYGAEHRRLRRAWAQYVAAGGVRCGRALVGQCLHHDSQIRPGEAWDLDHLPQGSNPSHADCNRAARTNPRRTA